MFNVILVSLLIANQATGYISEPSISLSISRFETGHFRCKNCALDGNNLFGFRTKDGFKKYPTVFHSIHDYSVWQRKHWKPFKAKNPNCDYYEFLEWRGYSDNMQQYIKTIKQL